MPERGADRRFLLMPRIISEVPMIAESGVRKSWEIARSRLLRYRSWAASSSERIFCLAARKRSIASVIISLND